MAVFGFFKRKKEIKRKEEVGLENLGLSEIRDWISSEIKKCEGDEGIALDKIRERIDCFVKGVEENMVALRDFDVEGKREDKRLKNVVEDARETYIGFLEILIKDIKNVDEERLDKFVNRISLIISNFDKKSFRNYERVTILIGDEMAEIKKNLQGFSGDVSEIFRKEKGVVDRMRGVLEIRDKFDEIDLADDALAEVENIISKLKNKISEIEKKRDGAVLELERIKKSGVYLENLAIGEKVGFLEAEAEKNILSLKQVVDFKELANFFHSDSKKMRVIKEYKDNFMESFKKDGGDKIVGLLEDSGMSREFVLDKISGIRKLRGEIKKLKEGIRDDKSLEVGAGIEKAKHNIEVAKGEILMEERRVEKLKGNKDVLVEDLRKKMIGFGVEI